MASGPQEITNISEVLPAPTSNGTATANGSSSGGSGSGNGEKALAPRKERSKSRDLGKRMGGGQKGVWSKPGEVISPVAAVDDNDPNYDSEGEENVILVSTSQSPVKKASPVNLAPDALAAKELAVNPPPAIKKRIIEIIDEYLISADAEEVKSSLKEMNEDEFQYEVVKRAITIAMDKNDKERELVSRLFSHLYLNGLTPSQIAMGFRRVLLLADDLQIDIPNARSMLAIFIARGVVDEIVPPSFLEDPFIHRYTPDIAADAIKKLSINHGTARLEKAWGPGDGRPVGELKVAIDQLTKEYLLSSDLDEAARCVRELNVPHFHHEVVKRGLLNALEEEDGVSGDARSTAMSSLLAYLVAQEIVSSDQLRKGFERMKIGIPDVALDIPNASTLFNALVDRAKRDGILPTSFDATAPSSQ